jgi:saccharopine dehydrogenase-like NADP-dependent oxidoreductase
MHYVQLYFSGTFQMFDYKQGNKARYNSTIAPLYNLKAITAPVYIYAAEEDWIISQIVSLSSFFSMKTCKFRSFYFQDAAKLRSLMPNSPKLKIISNWNHIDFTYSKNARKILYNEMLSDFERALN